MKVLRFTLKGKTAFFKKPEVSTYYYFTYGNIHKIALLGMFGAILGYGGYTQQYQHIGKKKELVKGYPEFYSRLLQLKISICPNVEKGFIPKKIQFFNNSVGYASKEQGGNLIIKEQWLEEPSWEICVLLDCEEADRLARAMLENRYVYIPYLGKNDHPADILNVCIEEVEEQESGVGKLCGLFLKKNATIVLKRSLCGGAGMTYKYQENLPFAMEEWTNQYLLESFIDTDAELSWEGQMVYLVRQKARMFY